MKIDIFWDNSLANAETYVLEVTLDVPTGLNVHSTQGVTASGGGKYAGNFDIQPGGARTLAVNTQASESGEKTIHMTGSYYPKLNPGDRKPINLKKFVAVGTPTPTPADPPTPTPADPPTPTPTDPPTPTPTDTPTPTPANTSTTQVTSGGGGCGAPPPTGDVRPGAAMPLLGLFVAGLIALSNRRRIRAVWDERRRAPNAER